MLLYGQAQHHLRICTSSRNHQVRVVCKLHEAVVSFLRTTTQHDTLERPRIKCNWGHTVRSRGGCYWRVLGAAWHAPPRLPRLNGKWLPIYRALVSVNIASVLFTALTYDLSMSDPSPSTLTVLNSNFLQLGRRSGGRPQRTVYPRRLPVNWPDSSTAHSGYDTIRHCVDWKADCNVVWA